MNILIPMAGAGSRFTEAGYKVSKPAIPTYDKRTGKKDADGCLCNIGFAEDAADCP